VVVECICIAGAPEFAEKAAGGAVKDTEEEAYSSSEISQLRQQLVDVSQQPRRWL